LACFRWDFVGRGFDGGILGILAVVLMVVHGALAASELLGLLDSIS
jgi:hypothetical protein